MHFVQPGDMHMVQHIGDFQLSSDILFHDIKWDDYPI